MARSSEDGVQRAEPTLDAGSSAPAKGSDRTSIASASQILKQLELTNLRIEDEPSSSGDAEAISRTPGYGPGYNPYDRTAPVRPPPKKAPKR